MIWSYTGWSVVRRGEEAGVLGIAESDRVVQLRGSGLWIWGRIPLQFSLSIDAAGRISVWHLKEKDVLRSKYGRELMPGVLAS
jgi:hypothetical protein